MVISPPTNMKQTQFTNNMSVFSSSSSASQRMNDNSHHQQSSSPMNNSHSSAAKFSSSHHSSQDSHGYYNNQYGQHQFNNGSSGGASSSSSGMQNNFYQSTYNNLGHYSVSTIDKICRTGQIILPSPRSCTFIAASSTASTELEPTILQIKINEQKTNPRKIKFEETVE